ncbi:kita-kyushu lung cancer antigen 1 isoform X2 [Herpailurus yagouaroundi]|uniref:kita-kyushu lung cancer antigen 1 isoform X2 n=1 Tax=Herpailurus yagouaroundi TaxID=1608482 RepID=UPI001AD630EE|nr:kita-kyushu lung cancer antigen 1 isoform X2 [Puma yagouaroundi]
MSMLLLLLSFIVFALLLVVWKSRFQSSVGEMSSSSTSLALVRATSSTGSTKSNTDNLSVDSISRGILINSPHTIAMQKRILINLRIVEYKLAELEHFLIIKGLNGTLANCKSTDRLRECNESEGNH